MKLFKKKSKILIELVLALVVVGILIGIVAYFFPQSASAAWYSDNWKYRKQLTIDNTKVDDTGSADYTNFPVLVSLTDSSLGTNAQTDGDDIMFTSSDGTTQLDHEIESYDPQTGKLVAWVEIPTLDYNNDTPLYMYYGNSTASSQQNINGSGHTWNTNYVGVWHMKEDPSGSAPQIQDSTSTNNDGTSGGSMTSSDLIDCKVGKCIDFDGNNDYIDLGDYNAVQTTYTVEFWYKSSGSTGTKTIFHRGDSNDCFYNPSIYISSDAVTFSIAESGCASGGKIGDYTVTANQWHHVAVTRSGNTAISYIDGILQTTDTSQPNPLAEHGKFLLGVQHHSVNGNSNFFSGLVDEVKVSNTDRTAGWIATEYNNQSAPGSFFRIGSEEKSKDPVLYWSLNDASGTSAQDSSPNNLDGTLNNTPTWKTEDMCIYGKCLYFDGATNQNVSLASNDKLNFISSENFSVSLWAKRNGASSANNFLLTKANTSATYTGYKVYMDASGDLCFNIRDGTHAEDTACTSAVDFDDNKWHQITGVKTGTTKIELFVDGNLRASDSSIASTDTLSNTGTFYIGVDSDGTSTEWLGFIDEVKVYDTALSLNQVRGEVISKGAVKGVSVSMGGKDMEALSEGLVGYWKMDETSGVNVADTSGNSNTGTLTNAQETAVGLDSSTTTSITDTDYASLSATNDVYNGMIISMSGATCNVTGQSRTISDYDGTNKIITVGVAFSAAPDTDDCTYTILHQVSGKFGNNLQFDGINDYAVMSNPSVGSNFSVSLWIKPSSNLGTSIQGVFDTKPSSLGALRIYSSGWGELRFDIGGNSAFIQVAIGDWTNQWHYLTLVLTNTYTTTLYIDGIYAGKQVSTIAASSNTFRIGMFNTSYFKGVIDETRIYNRALSAQEVRDLYNFAPGPIGYWKLDDKIKGASQTILDSSGNGNNGTTYSANGTGMDCSSAPGKNGGGCSFDGTDDYITTATTTGATGFNIDQGTYSLWVKPNSNWDDNAYRPFIQNSLDGNSWQYNIRLEKVDNTFSNQILFGYKGDFSTCRITYQYTAGNWFHLAATWEGSDTHTGKIYINGVLQKSCSFTATTTATDFGKYFIGRESDVAGRFANGVLDEVKVYNYARTQKQIVSDLNAGHPNVGSPIGSAVGYYDLDEGADNTCKGGTNDVCNLGSGSSTLDGTSTAARSIDCKFGKCLDFDGADDVVTVTNSNAVDFDTGLASGVSFSAWFYADSDGEGDAGRIIDKGANTYISVSGQSGSNLNIAASLALGTTTATKTLTAPVVISAWNHIVMTYTDDADDEITLYVNGKNYGSSTNGVGAPATTDTNNLLIGNNSGGTNTFDGKIDEVKVYGYELTSDEVKTEYNKGSSSVLGALGNNSTYQPNAQNQEYCVPGDATSCVGPVGRWDFEEGKGTSAFDSSGNGKTGTWYGTGNHWTSGKYGKGGNFTNSGSDYIDFSYNYLGYDSMTLEGWVKPLTSYSDYSSRIFFGGAAQKGCCGWGTGIGYSGYSTANKFGFTVVWDDSVNALTYTVNGSTLYQLNTWYYVVGVLSGSNVYLYVNGKLENIGTLPGARLNTTQNWKINKVYTSYSQLQLDNIRLFNYARTPAQIAWDYSKGAPVGYWDMDECSGTIINDRSGNKYTGTLAIGATVPQTAAGTCTDGLATSAWYNGVSGKRNYSVNFDGVDDAITTAAFSPLATAAQTTTNISWGGWFYPTTSAATKTLLEKATEFRLRTDDTSNAICGVYYTGAFHDATSVTAPLTIDTWNHILCTYDGINIKTYVNGVLKNTTLEASPVTAVSSILYFAKNSSSQQYYSGKIDDVKIFNYPLTATQVKDYYNSGAVNFGPNAGSP